MIQIRPLSLPSGVFSVAGARFYQRHLAPLVAGTTLHVQHEPQNPHDPKACVVRDLRRQTVGYVPAVLAPRLLATSASVWTAEVVEVWDRVKGPGAAPHPIHGIRIRILQRSDPPPAPRVVTTRHGRVLGYLVGEVAAELEVRTENGAFVVLPRELALIADLAPSSDTAFVGLPGVGSGDFEAEA